MRQREDLAAISPYLTDRIMRFGTYATTELTVRPDAFDPNVDVEFEAEEEAPAPRVCANSARSSATCSARSPACGRERR